MSQIFFHPYHVLFCSLFSLPRLIFTMQWLMIQPINDLCFFCCFFPLPSSSQNRLGPYQHRFALLFSISHVLLGMLHTLLLYSLIIYQGQLWDSDPSKYFMSKDKNRHNSFFTPFGTVLDWKIQTVNKLNMVTWPIALRKGKADF